MPAGGLCLGKAITLVCGVLLTSANRDLYIHRTSILLVSLPKSFSEQVPSVSPAGFGLGFTSFSSHPLKLLQVLIAHFPENPTAWPQSLRC